MKELLNNDIKHGIKQKLLDLQKKTHLNDILEKKALKYMAEDFDVSDCSDDSEEEESLPEEFYEQIEVLFTKENIQMRKSNFSDEMLEEHLFNKDYFINKGLNETEIFEQTILENEEDLANELVRKDEFTDKTDSTQENFKKVN